MKIKKILSVFMAMLTIFSVLSVNAYALNWDGSSAGGSTNAVNGNSKGYVIRATEDDYCVVGYRFSVVNSAGNLKVNKVIDVYRNSTNGDNAYSTSAKFSTKYNKKQLIANKDAKLKTTLNTTNCYKEKDMGFVSKLPNPSGVKTWQAYETNINKVLTKIGVGTVANMSYGDKVIIEPLFDVCLAGEYQALTVTEIAYCGRSVKGGSSNGGTSNGTSSTWGFIANYTNRIWPNKLYTPDGQGLWTAASKIADGSKETFNNILTKGYGAGIAYTEDKAPVLTIVYDCYGSSVKMTDTSKGFTLGEYNRLCSTSSAHKTVAGTANVYYHTLEYDKALGTNGLHDFSTFGLSAPTGYKFKAWHGAKCDFNESTQYKASQLSDDIKNGDTYEWMSATFSPITYSVRFNGNGSTSGSMSNESFTYDVAKALTANAFKREFTVTYNYNGNGTSNTTAKATATFNGWAKTSSGSVAYTNKQSVKNLSSTQGAVVDIYAKWTDGSVTLPTPTRTGYKFSGWYTATSGGTKVGGGGDSYKPTKNITLYARWTPITYTVKYYLDGTEQTGKNQTCSYGTSYKYAALSSVTGYTITGWWSGSSASSKGTQYTPGSSFSNLTTTDGAVIKRYSYSTGAKYTVQYYLDGVEQTALKQSCNYDTSYNYPTLPSKTGYTVSGWYSGSSASSKGTQYAAGGSFKNLTSTNGGTIKRYAYSTANTYTVQYYLDGVEQTSLKQTCTYGTSYKYPSLPTKTGYTVSGWWSGSSSASKGTQYTAGASFSNLTSTKGGTIKRYAYSTANTYTVQYYLDGVEQTSLKQTCTYGTSYKYPSLPAKTGYTVSGWWSGSSSTSKGTQYAAGGSFSNLTSTNGGTIKRYAYSTANTYTVQYYLDGVEQTALKQTCTYGTSYKYPSLPTKTGYSVNGWWSGSSSTSKGTQYAAGGSFSNLTATNGGSVKRYAYSDSKSYTVSYYLDGVEQTALKQTCSYDSTYKYPVVPTKTGYVITGWWSGSSSTSKGTQYAAGASFSNLTSTSGGSVKRYAYSTPITYEVKFNGNGATSGTMNNQKFTYDVAQNLTANAFIREFTVTYNYNGNGAANTSAKATATFNGWAKTSTGTKAYDNKQNVINLASTQDAIVNIYAKWTDGNVTLPTPTRTGYVFDGWYTTTTGTTKIGNGGDKYTPSKNITVYAHWKPITYTVSYYLDGVEQTSLKQTCTYDTSYKYSTLPVKTGYTVSGWWSGSSASSKGTQYAAGASFTNLTSTNGGTIKRYAYSTANTYTVQYYLDGVEQTSLKQTCTYGTSYKYPSLPTKTGYTVTGWWSGSSSTSKGTQYTAGGSFSNLTSTNGGTVKRYAYSDSKSYSVSYYLDGVEQTELKQTCSYDSTYKYPAIPTKTGYVITGWWSGSSATSKGTQYAAGGSFSNLTSTDGGLVKRYAYSTPITYEVKFNGNGATSGTMNNQKFTYDVAQNLTANAFKREFTVTYNYNGNGTANTSEKATATFNGWAKTTTGTKAYDNKQNVINLASTQDAVVNIYAKWTDGSVILPTPTRTGYIFDGWYNSASGTTKIGEGGDKYTPSKDITVYAHWTPITYTIKFDGNGSTSGATASMAMTYDVAKNLTANGFVRNGYKFVKWNLKADGTSTDYTDKQSVKNLTTVNGKVITMYAQWEEIQVLRLEAIEPNADYREGTEVISSFNIINEGSTDCLHDNNVSVVFKVYKNSTVIKTVTLEKVVVPANDKNLLYFKWTVPENLGNATIYISGEIVTNGKSDSLIKNAYSTCKYVVSATPDTQFEYSAPDNFFVPASPANSSTTAKWSEWKYENGAFKKYNYGIGISDELPSLVPAASANASLNNGMWTMKSGYGVEITLANGMKSISGYTMPGSGSYTAPQYSTVMFPEFSFLNTLNNFRTLELVNNQWMFRENGTYGRIHFTPLWYPDGLYSVNVVQRDCWTPAGMISRTINTKDITISGSAYDDWIIS